MKNFLFNINKAELLQEEIEFEKMNNGRPYTIIELTGREKTMTFEEMIKEYGFVTNTSWHFKKGLNEVSTLIIEKKVLSEGGIVYDFYKIKLGRFPEVKMYCESEDEIFLISRVQKYFDFIEKERIKKRLQPYGGSMIKYQESLRVQKKECIVSKKRILKHCETVLDNLELHDEKTSRRKQAPNQMRMKL